MTPAEIAPLVNALRELGVTEFTDGPLRIVLGPMPAVKRESAPTDDKTGVRPMACPCGHSWTRHRNGGCLAGCSIQQCVPKVGLPRG